MQKALISSLLASLMVLSCTDKTDCSLTAFEVFCEMVANDAKPIALHQPMEPNAVDKIWNQLVLIADKYNVQLYLEDDFPVSLLFPAEATEGKSVVMIYRGNRLKQYEQWKDDIRSSDPADTEKAEALARRFGRLLGYAPQGINELLSKNSDYKSLASFGVKEQITHLYYEDVDRAIDFYENVLGLEKKRGATFRIGAEDYIKLNAHNKDHEKDQTKSTAIALLTDELPEWYTYIQEQKVPIKYTYKPREGGPHDGFVAIDPGGYLLEFEQFKQHTENELFIAVLAEAPWIKTKINGLSFYGSITWTYHNDLLLMQRFYEEVLGYQLVSDQGWTKIYQTSITGFIGLVDERRGMEDYSDTKAVEIEWRMDDIEQFDAYAMRRWTKFTYEESTILGPEMYIYKFGNKYLSN